MNNMEELNWQKKHFMKALKRSLDENLINSNIYNDAIQDVCTLYSLEELYDRKKRLGLILVEKLSSN